MTFTLRGPLSRGQRPSVAFFFSKRMRSLREEALPSVRVEKAQVLKVMERLIKTGVETTRAGKDPPTCPSWIPPHACEERRFVCLGGLFLPQAISEHLSPNC